MSWDTALAWAAGLFDGSVTSGGVDGDCGLSDGSLAGQWRLPTHAEFVSLAYMESANPAISNTEGTGQWTPGDPFIDLALGSLWWWTSTSTQTAYQNAWLGFPKSHALINIDKTSGTPFAWAVRSLQ